MEDLAWRHPTEPVERAALRFCEAIARWRGKPELETVSPQITSRAVLSSPSPSTPFPSLNLNARFSHMHICSTRSNHRRWTTRASRRCPRAALQVPRTPQFAGRSVGTSLSRALRRWRRRRRRRRCLSWPPLPLAQRTSWSVMGPRTEDR